MDVSTLAGNEEDDGGPELISSSNTAFNILSIQTSADCINQSKKFDFSGSI